MLREVSTRTDPLFFGLFLPVLAKCTKDALVAEGNDIDREERDSRRYSITRAIGRRFMADSLYARGLKETSVILIEVANAALVGRSMNGAFRLTERVLRERLGEEQTSGIFRAVRSELKRLSALDERHQRDSIRRRYRTLRDLMRIHRESVLKTRMGAAVSSLVAGTPGIRLEELFQVMDKTGHHHNEPKNRFRLKGFSGRDETPVGVIDARTFSKRLRETYSPSSVREKAMGLFRRGLDSLDRRKFARAVSCFKRSLECAPEVPFALYNMGLAYEFLDDYFMAIDCYRKAVALDRDFRKGWVALGSCYSILEWAPAPGLIDLWNAKHRREGLRACAEALRIDPLDGSVHVIMGKCHADLGEKDRALERYLKATHLEPGLAIAWLGVASIRYNDGDFGRAIQSSRKALRNDPQLTGAWNLLGASQISCGQFGPAVMSLRRAVTLNPRLPYLWENLGAAYTALHDAPRASECLDIARILQPGTPGRRV